MADKSKNPGVAVTAEQRKKLASFTLKASKNAARAYSNATKAAPQSAAKTEK